MPRAGETSGRIVNGELEIAFTWATDRYTHTILGTGLRLEAAEAEGLDTPVFQEVHQQGEVLFLSGMSGGRHWSASVEPAGEGFAFDVACRVKAADQPAGSVYSGAGFQIEPIITDGKSPERDGLKILAASEKSEAPYTIRYRYRITRPT